MRSLLRRIFVFPSSRPLVRGSLRRGVQLARLFDFFAVSLTQDVSCDYIILTISCREKSTQIPYNNRMPPPRSSTFIRIADKWRVNIIILLYYIKRHKKYKKITLWFAPYTEFRGGTVLTAFFSSRSPKTHRTDTF